MGMRKGRGLGKSLCEWALMAGGVGHSWRLQCAAEPSLSLQQERRGGGTLSSL